MKQIWLNMIQIKTLLSFCDKFMTIRVASIHKNTLCVLLSVATRHYLINFSCIWRGYSRRALYFIVRGDTPPAIAVRSQRDYVLQSTVNRL